ncbi:unnamed protein product, partial [Effrenium voratum]
SGTSCRQSSVQQQSQRKLQACQLHSHQCPRKLQAYQQHSQQCQRNQQRSQRSRHPPLQSSPVPQLKSAKADLVQYLLGSAVPPAELPADLPAKQPPAKPCAAQRAKRKRFGAETLQEGDTKKRFCSRAYGAAKVAAQAAGVDPLEPARQAHRQAAEIWDKALLACL